MNPRLVYSLIDMNNPKTMDDSRLNMIREQDNQAKIRNYDQDQIFHPKMAFDQIENKITPKIRSKKYLQWSKNELGRPNKPVLIQDNLGKKLVKTEVQIFLSVAAGF